MDSKKNETDDIHINYCETVERKKSNYSLGQLSQ